MDETAQEGHASEPSTLTAHAYLRKRFAALLIDPQHEGVNPYVFSGFVVRIGLAWLWVTASHCAQNISHTLQQYPKTTISLVVFSGRESGECISVAQADWSFTDFQASLRAYAQSQDDQAISTRDIELFDLALWPIPPLIQCYLLNAGFTGFSESEVVTASADVLLSMQGSKLGLYIGGIPDVTYSIDYQESALVARFQVFPLHPSPDDGADGGNKREIEFEGPFAWVPTSWKKEHWNSSIQGVSGGPMVVLDADGRCHLGGLVARERSQGSNPTHVGIVDVRSVLTAIQEVLNSDD